MSCSQAPDSVLEPVGEVIDRPPVVFLPGVTGIELRDPATGRSVWGEGRNLIRPHDRGYATARPIVGGRGAAAIAAGEVILQLRLFGLIRKRVYQQVVDVFQGHGYRLGDLERPGPRDDLFLFAYDWRQDNIESARRLAERLEHLRRIRGAERLDVVLICQSNGAHICRYFSKYGALGLVEAEAGETRRPSTLGVEKLVLVGSSNGGSLRILRELNRGRKYVGWIGREWGPETLFTFLSLFQDLPVYTDDLFVDEDGRPLAVDLFDAESWRRFEWSIFSPRVAARLARDRRPDLFGSAADRYRHLRRALDRAARFHRLLRRDEAVPGATRYFLIQNSHNETPARAVLRRVAESWRTLFAGDPEVERRPGLKATVTVPGDGHATVESQLWLSPGELERLAWDPVDVDGEHFEMILNPATLRHLLEIVDADLDPRHPRGGARRDRQR
jgi:hypothetical protein